MTPGVPLLRRASLCAMLMLAVPGLAGGAFLSPLQTKLVASDGAAADGFGAALALWGDRLAVGASGDATAAGANAGSVRTLRWNGTAWNPEATLEAADAAVGDRFGGRVALHGDRLAVRASSGVYVYHWDDAAWTQQAKLAGGCSGSLRDACLALHGDHLVVGVPQAVVAGVGSGAAQVFGWNGTAWSPTATLVPPDAEEGMEFGSAVALNGSTLLVGAPYANTAPGVYGGAAYVFTYDGAAWAQQAKLMGPDPGPLGVSGFGRALALDGDAALVGDSLFSVAYVFRRGGSAWTEEARLRPLVGNGDQFGFAVALHGEVAVVTDPDYAPLAGNETGVAFVFRRHATGWVQESWLAASGGGLNKLGRAVGLDAGRLAVGAPFADEKRGAVHVFHEP